MIEFDRLIGEGFQPDVEPYQSSSFSAAYFFRLRRLGDLSTPLRES